MSTVVDMFFFVIVFLSVYIQVFFLYTFFENRKKIRVRRGKVVLSDYPGVTLAVPCWNEEHTISATVESLLALNYPKEKLFIYLVDDGSTDRTFKKLQAYAGLPNVRIFQKENGGKHTALNLALEHTTTPFFGCLDADSYADPEALVRIMSYFEQEPNIMAVAPSIIVNQPKAIIEQAQRAEYLMSVYVKKMLGFIDGIHVAPGPLTIFSKKVFDELGYYRHAHNTEDMEIAYRMQKNGYRIEQCNDAYVYTSTPKTIKKLFKQRLRWMYGFLNNTIDYKEVLFKPKYGNFSVFTLPAGLLSVVMVSFLLGKFIYNLGSKISNEILKIQVSGVDMSMSLGQIDFDIFYFDFNYYIFIMFLLYGFVFTSIYLGYRISTGKIKNPLFIFYFIAIYTVVAPIWLLKSMYNTILAKKPAWR